MSRRRRAPMRVACTSWWDGLLAEAARAGMLRRGVPTKPWQLRRVRGAEDGDGLRRHRRRHGAILFFAGDDAACITGQVPSVSGGPTMAG